MSKSGFFKQLESLIGNSYRHVVSLLNDLDGKPVFPYLYLYHIQFEQINAFHSRCDHRYPSCTRGHRTRSNRKYRLAMKNTIAHVQEKYTHGGSFSNGEWLCCSSFALIAYTL